MNAGRARLGWSARAVGAAGTVAIALLLAACDSGSGDAAGDAATQDTQEDAQGADSTSQDTTQADTGTNGDAADDVGEEPDTFVSPQCAIPEGKTCNALCNTGCNEGQGCLFLGSNWECVTAGTTAPGQPCSNPQDCAAGLCGSSGDDPAVCMAPCLSDEDCAEQGVEGGVCNANVAGASPFRFCGAPPPPCDLWAEAPCENVEEACYPSSGGTLCAKFGKGGPGDPCAQPSACQPQHTCVTIAGTSACVRLCNTAGGDQSCNAVCGGQFDTLTGQAGVGFCSEDIELPICTPLNPTECKPNEGCYQGDGGWYCGPAGLKEEKEACSSSGQCQPGLTCWANKCRVICDPKVSPSNPKCASAAISCVALDGQSGYCDQ